MMISSFTFSNVLASMKGLAIAHSREDNQSVLLIIDIKIITIRNIRKDKGNNTTDWNMYLLSIAIPEH